MIYFFQKLRTLSFHTIITLLPKIFFVLTVVVKLCYNFEVRKLRYISTNLTLYKL